MDFIFQMLFQPKLTGGKPYAKKLKGVTEACYEKNPTIISDTLLSDEYRGFVSPR